MAEFNLARIRYTWKNVWLAGATYIKDDIVRHGGNNYVCMEGHLSDQTSFETDITAATPKWLLMGDGYQWRGNWSVETRYRINDLVKYNGIVYRVIDEHLSATTQAEGISDDSNKFLAFASTEDWSGVWSPLTRYRIGDIIRYGAIVYKCIEEHTSSSTTAGLEQDQAKWQLTFKGNDFKLNWAPNSRYKIDDVVKYGAIVYRCNQGHTSAATGTLGLEDDLSKWDVVLHGIDYKGYWQDNGDSSGLRYKVGDLVKYGPTMWRCKEFHTSLATFDENKFDIWMPGLGFEAEWSQSTSYQPGDIVRYGGYTYTSMTNNLGSAPSVTGVFYEGESLQGLYDWELLITGYKITGEWSSSTSYRTGDVVRNNGFVYIAVQDSTNQQPDALSVESQGYYDPGETRSANGGYSMYWQLVITGVSYQGEWIETKDYVLGDIVVQAGQTWKCVQAHEGDDSSLVEPSLDTTYSYWIKHIVGAPGNVMEYIGDIRTHDGTNHVRRAIGNPGEALKVVSADNAWEALGSIPKVYYVATSGQDISGAGLTATNPFKTIKYATQYILGDEANRAPATIFVSTGIFEEILPIKVPAGVAIVGDELRSTTVKPREGSEDQDMFQVRNGCGIRNMTLEGLQGTLGTPDTYGASVPSAGAFVALDPGTGPSDSSVWITNKSTYVQNVTTIGTACVGLKIDGALHNSGNKSIVANDFTQVISDGIGVWANKDGRAELVSVFTYYCHIGYYATSGGKLRATNGNNSYGKYGSFAEGELVSETPITATINNRYYNAIAPTVYSNANQIFALGYTHAGEEYTNATYAITGSGSGVGVDNAATDTRNGGISELRLLDPGDSSTPGGRGHITGVRNSAQGGDSISITIAQADANTPEYYVGRAITAVNGIGAADANRVGNVDDAPYTYPGVTATSNNPLAKSTVGAFTVSVDETGAATVTVTNGGHSHRLGDTITILDSDIGNFGGANLTFNVSGISESMKIIIEEGEGVGQFGIIDEYFTTTKKINVLRESDGKRGWDHLVPGWPITTTLDGSTTYRIESRIEVEAPPYAEEGFATGYASTAWQDCFSATGSTMVAFPATGTDKALYSNAAGDQWTPAIIDADFVRPTAIVKCKGKLKYFIAVGVGTKANLSTAGTAWGSTAYSINQHNWVSIVEGPYTTTSHTVIAMADDSDEIAISTTDGTSWTYVNTGFGTGQKFLAYGNGKWMIVKEDGSAIESINDGQSWQTATNVAPGTYNVTGFAFGNGRFVASVQPNGTATFVFDPSTTMINSVTGTTSATFGLNSTFYISFTDKDTGPTNSSWLLVSDGNYIGTRVFGLAYQDGLFMAISVQGDILYGDGGHVWNSKPAIPLLNAQNYRQKIHPMTLTSNTGTAGPRFMITPSSATANLAAIKFGAKAKMRAFPVTTGRIDAFTMSDTGSGYDAGIPPQIHVHDTQKTTEVTYQVRVKNRVLGQPNFTNRGAAYTKFNAVTITGDGYADLFQIGGEIIVSGLSLLPSPGDNFRVDGINDVIYKVGTATVLEGAIPNATAKLTISPNMGVQESPNHAVSANIRQNYSQVRLTFHDFLDIGTGNFGDTAYPLLYTDGFGNINPPEQSYEAQEYNGGRVFYASTDQDGNFRVGELFKVEQSTGIVTINASQFDLKGLDELRLGAFILGGTNAVIREFSKEQTFVANSNNIVPTQKAIAAYLQGRISGGGSNVAANAVTAGTCKFSDLNHISNTGGIAINIPVTMHMTKIPSGMMMAQAFFNGNMDTMMLTESQDDFEGSDGFYDGGENGYGPGGL